MKSLYRLVCATKPLEILKNQKIPLLPVLELGYWHERQAVISKMVNDFLR